MTLQELQKALITNNLDAYIVTRGNMFLGQDILPEENKVQELCGFSGSAGTLLVFRNKAYLFVDGRYELQAAQEVNQEQISVICTKDTLGTWMQNNLDDPCKIAYNPWCHSISEVDYWGRTLKKHTFVEDKNQLLGNRLSDKEVEIFEQDIQYAGISMDEKISYLTKFMQEKKLDAFFICEPDCVSWLTNLRSETLADTPLLRAFALIDAQGEVSLFTTDFKKIETELARLRGCTIGLSYSHTPKQLQNIMKDHRLWLINLPNPIQSWKAIKNPIELNGFKNAHKRDAVAVVNFLQWLENNWQGHDELSIVAKLHDFRSQQQKFYGNSFETIAGFAANGAIVHYQPSQKTNLKLKEGNILLLDSGAQYFDGTTDITRTIAIGSVTNQEIIDSFTQVLKAHIAAASALFPQGTPGSAIDALARAQLWQYGKDYNHGTGHGVGHFLNVHEGPHSLSPRSNATGLEPKMITSIEPGYYKAEEYGIRIENLAVIENEDNPDFERPMCHFVPLILVPIDKRLINKYLLNNKEKDWLNHYHKTVLQELDSLVSADVRKWLKTACSPL